MSKVINLIDACREVGISDEQAVKLLVAFLEREDAAKVDPLDARNASGRARQARYRARRGLTEAEWLALREQVIKNSDPNCSYCDRIADPPFIDHIIPLAKGGTNDVENLCIACGTCNGGKSGKTPSEWRGWQ